jgi:hypothetical protein
MPYLTGIVEEIEKALFMRKFNVPFWALSYTFGKDPMYWYRIEKSLGRNSIIGTTIRNADDVPAHLGADEKHTRILSPCISITFKLRRLARALPRHPEAPHFLITTM